MFPLSYPFFFPEKCHFVIVYIYSSHLNHKEATAFVQHRTRKQNHIEIRRTLFHVSVNSSDLFSFEMCVKNNTLLGSIIITKPTNALIVCNLFLNHFFKTLSLLLHVSIAYCLSSSGSTYSS